MTATFFFLLVIFLMPFIPVNAQTNPDIQSKDTIRLEEYACIAKDPPTLKECINQVRNIQVPLVKINAPIKCSSQAECAFDLQDIKADATFFAAKIENRIIRSKDFNYTVFNINNSSGLKFSGLTFEDEGISGCPAGTTCPPFFLINKSSDIIIEGDAFVNLKSTAVLISDSRKVTVNKSNFLNGLKNGIDVIAGEPIFGINITENNFEGMAGNAISYQAVNSVSSSSSITSNTFSNNHAKGFYENCSYPCTGSQVKIAGPTANLEFRKNKITGGTNTIFDSLGLYPSGLEIGSSEINNLRIFCNEISGNLGSGIVQAEPISASGQISADENKIWGNGIDLNTISAIVTETNCYNDQCNLACMTN